MLAIDDKDFGTPQRKADKLVTLEVDGCSVTVPEGTSSCGLRRWPISRFRNYAPPIRSNRLVPAGFA